MQTNKIYFIASYTIDIRHIVIYDKIKYILFMCICWYITKYKQSLMHGHRT